MRMERRLLFPLLTLLLAMVSIAADAKDSIVLWTAKGEKITISFNERPKITFSNGETVITTNDYEVSYPTEELVNCTYEHTPDGIDQVDAGNMPTLLFTGNSMVVNGLPEASSVTVYNTAGLEIHNRQADKHGHANMDMSAMPSGVYIVKTTVGNFKIRKP